MLANSIYLEGIRREEIVTRIKNTVKLRKFEMKLTDKLINKAVKNYTLKE